MARLPNPGSDSGTWGAILNQFLGVEHNSDGTLRSTGSLAAKADKPKVSAKYFTAGDITLPNTVGVWQPILDSGGNRLEVSVAAKVGDWVELAITGMTQPSSGGYIDVAIIKATSQVRYLSLGTSTPAVEGETSFYPSPNAFRSFGYSGKGFVVTLGDLDDGAVRFVMVSNSIGLGTLYASNSYPFYMRALNIGPTL